jgi:hypothetical protein
LIIGLRDLFLDEILINWGHGSELIECILILWQGIRALSLSSRVVNILMFHIELGYKICLNLIILLQLRWHVQIIFVIRHEHIIEYVMGIK